MRLLRYRVTNFRSVIDSGWISIDDVTALIGVNESGKSNLLLPLWKLKPAREGDIRPTSDYPKTMFAEIRENPGSFCFISVEFDLGDVADRFAGAAGITLEDAQVVRVDRYYDGEYKVSFPRHQHHTTASAEEVEGLLQTALTEIKSISALAKEETQKDELVSGIESAILGLPTVPLSADELSALTSDLRALAPEAPAKTSSIFPRLEALAAQIDDLQARLLAPAPGTVESVKAAIIKRVPRFVYYSNYGNLDSEIYLPHVVDNLERDDLGEKEAAKARTLRVLFSFVRLEPSEILELGRDETTVGNPPRGPSEAEIAEVAERKRERSILLQSAGTTLTSRFKDWWKQGDYRFRFEADGNHFRIWVADERRPAEVELEGRSTGLQWFLSFYLVFLVESAGQGEHENAILLLDEPGLSLHPLAQYDLSKFFDNLAKTNQILYTTHSPFLVHADRLDRARKVYVDEKGATQATSDLRKGAELQPGAAYAVHSALGLSIADSLMLGCQPVIVEGSSDQHYLTAIKTLLVSSGRLKPARELVFPPAGGTKNTRMVASILTGRDEALPYMILDGDESGRRIAKELGSSLYQQQPDRLIIIDSYTDINGSEIEDLIPASVIASVIDRIYRLADNQFSDSVETGRPILDQIEAWAQKEKIDLEPGWKVEVSKNAKQFLLKNGISVISEEYVDRWQKLFDLLGSTTTDQ
ncbi:AAA family ATPase [Sphingopyxis witflariensis]|uniref:OLD family endonuclease n=1 Tax=Sphingopyxis witflariensis TaxID=173675 RepID=A0A246K4F2_9SPHN|nr:AAA family ATPase [Sphingopyxis witflariensis]OWR00349.1 OLD family endonuclease [Sphingopyxis witflariensis]